jgi:hypothetical protein
VSVVLIHPTNGDQRFGARAQRPLAEALEQAERCRIVREQRGASLVAALQ